MSQANVIIRPALVHRLDARDRALFLRCAAWGLSSRRVRLCWTAVTHLGGVWASIVAATLPLLIRGGVREAGREALATLVISHLFVQLVKRTVGRPRPSCATQREALVVEPDRFSFPSGHAAAAMAVAWGYATCFPSLAPGLIALAVLVGLSRVWLGVHYPGDVVAGQLLAITTGVIVHVA
jgi:undecaprenyl-diphosphatase